MATGAESSESIGPYRLDGRIGEGGMGEVYRGFDARLNRPVAIKMMHVAGPEQAPAVDRLLREARAASALNHPNIVTIYEIGRTPDGRSYIVQELIEGRTLRHLLEDPPPLDTMINIGTQVARALAAAHAAGIVHRDIKPENIMVRADGYVKVLDFGLARVTELDADPAGLPTRSQATVPGTILGTVAYMSPEQAHAGVAGPPSDVFTLGVVLYEMAAGRRPFAAPTTAGLLAAIVSEQPVALVRVNSAVSHGLDALVQRMLAKAPGHRPTAGEVEGALAAIQNPESSAGAAPAGGAPSHAVGRDVERAALQRAYKGVKNGRSLLLAVSGEAGIGKTTLVEDFLAELTASPERPIVTRGRCSEQLAGEEAYLPLLEALENLLHRGAASPVDAVMKAVAPTWYLQVAMVAQESVSTTTLRDERALSQERMKRELGAFFQDVSRSRPIVVVLEDLHWADVSTIDMLSYLAARFSDMRVLLLVTYRSTDMALAQHPFLRISHDLQSRGAFEELPLDFLELSDVERYLTLEFPEHAFPPSFGAMIHAKTEGNPLFMADLVRYIHASGGITQQDGQWRVSDRVEVSVRDLPASVRGMISWKIEQLDEADRRLLVAASVQGHEFDSATVADAADMDPGDVEERLDVLGRVHVFVSRGEEREFPDRTLTVQYRFVHVLYQNVLYASLQPTRRATLSGRVARALAAHHATEIGGVAGRLALLWEAARDFAQSAQYFFAAAQHAIGLFAFREAALLTDRGLHALSGAPEGPQRQQQELALQMVKAVALRSATGWVTVDVEHATARARQLCRELGDPPQVFPVLWGFGLLQLIRGQILESRRLADDLMVQAEATGDPAFLMAAHHLAGVCREHTGELAESRRLLERARELHLPGEHRKYEAMFGSDPGLAAHAKLGPALWVLGYPDRARDRTREAVALAQSLKATAFVFPLVMLQHVLTDRGEASEAIAAGDAALAICREYGLPQEAEWSRSYHGAALIAADRTDEGIDLLTDSLAVQERANAHIGRTTFLAMLADGLRQAGRIDAGLQVVDEGFVWAERTSEKRHVAELHRIRGELLRLAGQDAAAEESLRAAIAFAAPQQTKSFELRAATGLARLLMAAGRAPEARAVLAPVYGWFTEGHTTTDLVAAKTLLSELN